MSDPRTHAGTVHHVSFRVDDLDAALEFYEGVLGCKRLPRPDDLPGARGAWLEAGATQVHLTEMPADDGTGFPPKRIGVGAGHVAFHTDDLEAAEAAFRERGFDVVSGQFGIPQFFLQDPSGNIVEFTPF